MTMTAQLWQGIAKDLALCGLFVWLLWLPLGRRMASFLSMREPGTAVPAALGMAAWGVLVLAAGLLGALRPAVFIPLILLCALAVRTIRPAAGGGRIMFGAELLVLLAAAPLVLLVLGSTLAPETAFDSLNVHLPYARESAEQGRIAFAPNNWSSVMPALPLMSYITAFVLSGVTLAKLFNWSCYLLTGAVIYSFGRRLSDTLTAAAAAVFFLACPVALYEATTAMIDLPLSLFSAVAVLSLLVWMRDRERVWLDLSALAFGFALGCKYHAAFWGLPIASVLLWQSRSEGCRVAVRRLARFGLIALLPFLPWLLRAWWYTGNPVFPLANGLFPNPFFTSAMEEAARAAYANEGVGRSAGALLALPWTVTVHPGPFRGTIGWIFPAGFVLAAVRCRDAACRAGLFLAAVFFATWAVTAQEIRYLLPAVPLLAILTAFGFFDGQSRSRMARTGRVAGISAAVAFCVTSWPTVHRAIYPEWTYWHSWKSPLKYLSGRERAQEYLRRDVPAIFVYDYINATLGRHDRVLLLNDASRFYSSVPTLYSFTVEGERILQEDSEEGVLRRLAESRITHVLLNYNGLAPLPRVVPRQGAFIFLSPEFQDRSMERVFEANNVVLFRVRAQ